MWMVLVWLAIFAKGVSLSNDCSSIKNISVFPGEPFTLDLDEDGVEENSLVDGSGTEIARIKSGELTILDERYKDKLSAKGFSFRVEHATIKDKEQFTASVLYHNGSHCSRHYKVFVSGDRICSEIKKAYILLPDHSLTLAFDVLGVEEITLVDNINRTIAVTKFILQILDSDYVGSLNLITFTLRKPNATTMDQEYTARVLFRNGTRCLQHYLVTVPGFDWKKWFIPDFNPISLCPLLVIGAVLILVYVKKRNGLKERSKGKEKGINTELKKRRSDDGIKYRNTEKS
ncbi:uncharacterized protein ACNLHF_003319 [Anomaloglossus baeobatrachus]|uniref:uncharacterized protein LOC142257507 n=1 Tax=Anomaloglossus baeobatrachus TaxID=238106 RepID=UPI003F5025A0